MFLSAPLSPTHFLKGRLAEYDTNGLTIACNGRPKRPPSFVERLIVHAQHGFLSCDLLPYTASSYCTRVLRLHAMSKHSSSSHNYLRHMFVGRLIHKPSFSRDTITQSVELYLLLKASVAAQIIVVKAQTEFIRDSMLPSLTRP